MREIRRGIFETNSSSTHSISIRRNNNGLEDNYLKIEDDGYIHTQFGEYGWEINSYCSQGEKLSYLITMLCELNGIDTNWWGEERTIEETRSALDECDDFIRLNREIIEYTGCPNGIYLDDSEGYIDHQSCEDYRNLSEYFSDWGINNCIDFIFNGGICVHTDNDNH